MCRTGPRYMACNDATHSAPPYITAKYLRRSEHKERCAFIKHHVDLRWERNSKNIYVALPRASQSNCPTLFSGMSGITSTAKPSAVDVTTRSANSWRAFILHLATLELTGLQEVKYSCINVKHTGDYQAKRLLYLEKS